eukprot:2047167-Prymnesium_polylepis.1
MLCTCSPRGSPALSQEAQSARKSWCAAPDVFHVHTPASTLPTFVPEHLERSVGLRPSRERPTRSRAHVDLITGGTEGVDKVESRVSAARTPNSARAVRRSGHV